MKNSHRMNTNHESRTHTVKSSIDCWLRTVLNGKASTAYVVQQTTQTHCICWHVWLGRDVCCRWFLQQRLQNLKLYSISFCDNSIHFFYIIFCLCRHQTINIHNGNQFTFASHFTLQVAMETFMTWLKVSLISEEKSLMSELECYCLIKMIRIVNLFTSYVLTWNVSSDSWDSSLLEKLDEE